MKHWPTPNQHKNMTNQGHYTAIVLAHPGRVEGGRVAQHNKVTMENVVKVELCLDGAHNHLLRK